MDKSDFRVKPDHTFYISNAYPINNTTLRRKNIMVKDHENLICLPSVFAVDDEYQIFSLFSSAAIVTVRVGERTFYDDSNGVLRSNTKIHRVHVPMQLLDEIGEYTLSYRVVIERTPYFPKLEEEKSITLKFRPVRGGKVNIYHISDTHNRVEQPIKCGSYFGDKLDLLILNGDIPNHSGEIEYFNSIYQIAAGITKGECPCVFARGNHDTRGIHAEEMGQYIPTDNGRTYYTFRVGSVWGLVLDCGEDKDDSHPEYGGTVCFHDFRLKQTDFIKKVIKKAEYEDRDVEYKLIICHVPFTRDDEDPFNIEVELFTEWASLIRENIKPDLMLCGHTHTLEISPVGGEYDHRGQPCPVIIGSKPISIEGKPGFIGCALTLEGETAHVVFNCDSGTILTDESVKMGRDMTPYGA